MNYRTLITYSPYLLPLLVVVGLFVPEVSFAKDTIIGGILYDVALGFFGWIAGWSSTFLDYAINEFVINFGTNVTGSGVGAAIDSMWSVVRDVFNIIFIFAIVYLGFKMILGSDGSGTQRALVYLVIAALLVNFSLFISKFIVDFSNIMAQEVALSAFPKCQSTGAVCDPLVGTADVGGRFFTMMKLDTSVQPSRSLLNGTMTDFGYIFGISIVYIVATFAFASGAILLTIRYAVLCVFMVLSPFMFIGWILPQFQGTMRKYWTGFIGRAFYAPIYILMLYFAAAVVQASYAGVPNVAMGQHLTAANGAQVISSFGAGIGPFILSTVMLVMAAQIGSRLSMDGASFATRISRAAAKNTTALAPRIAGQYGAYGAGVAVDKGWSKAKDTKWGRRLANNFVTGDGVNVAATGAAKKSKDAKVGFSTTVRERQLRRQALDQSFADSDAIAAAEGIDINSTDEKDVALVSAARDAAGRIKLADLEEAPESKRNALLQYRKADDISKLFDSEKISSKEKVSMDAEYKNIIRDKIYTENGKLITEQLHNLSIKQLELLGDQFIREHAAFLAEGQMDDIKKSDRFSEGQKGQQKAARKAMFDKLAANTAIPIKGMKTKAGKDISIDDTRTYLFKETVRDDAGNYEEGKSLKASELAARSYTTFVDKSTGKIHEHAKKFVKVDVLKQISRNAAQAKPGSMNDEDREKLGAAILNTEGMVDARMANYLKSRDGGDNFFQKKEDVREN